MAARPQTRATAAAVRGINGFTHAEMLQFASDYKTGAFSYPSLGTKHRATENTVRRFDSVRNAS